MWPQIELNTNPSLPQTPISAIKNHATFDHLTSCHSWDILKAGELFDA
jgi:hypothetical protein